MGFGVFLGYAFPALAAIRAAFDAFPVAAEALCHMADVYPALESLVELFLS